ncbi:MAG: hypothetical protein RL385_2260, partial [Pseudomonadota bacterium]
MALGAGSVVAGKYRIEREIGAGGMGIVYVAHNLNLGRDEALKVLYERFVSNEEAGRRFVQEARAAAKLPHPGVVNVFDSGQDACGYWIAMELLEGESLGMRLRRGPLSDAELSVYVPQLLDTLESMHGAGVVHRDLKPDNIFLESLPSGASRTRILDFGVAKYADAAIDMYATQAHSSLGTPHYMAPEQATHASTADARADLYSFGVILYECVTGGLPYEAQSFGELVLKMHNQAPKSQRVRPTARVYLETALACLQVEPNARPQDAAAVAVMLGLSLPSLPPPLPSPRPRDKATSPWLMLAGAAVSLGGVMLAAVALRPQPAPRGVAPTRPAVPAMSPEDAAVAELVDAAPEPDAGDDPDASHADAGLALPGPEDPHGRPHAGAVADAGTWPRTIAGPLSASVISAVVRSNRGELQRCYERELRATGGRETAAVKITVTVAVAPRGITTHVST